jgi:tetratricopeptide (TPR) repeat protein
MLKEVGKYQAAEAAYRRAFSQSPKEGDTHFQPGHLLKLTGRNEEAIAVWRNAARLLADNSVPLAELSTQGVTENAPTQLCGGCSIGPRSSPSELASFTPTRRFCMPGSSLATERAVMEARWVAEMAVGPSINSVWHMATLPSRLLSAPPRSGCQ